MRCPACLLALNLFVLSFAIAIGAEQYCYSQDPQKYYYFGAKTSYEVNHGDLASIKIPNKCEPIRFWSLNRHGTRYSVKISLESATLLSNLLKEIVKNFERSESELCKDDIELLKSWDSTVIVGLEDQLTPAGFEELKNIARRYKDKFPQLLNFNYSDSHYYFQHTDSMTTKQSFKGYVEGLFGKDAPEAAVESNKVIRQVKLCSGWDVIMDERNIKYNQKMFKKEPEFQDMVKNVSMRLGFKEALNSSTVLVAYDFCRFKKAWNFSSPSPWCSLFTKQQLKVLEYWEDLRYYYKGGYGQEDINPKIGCVLVKDFYKTFERAMTNLNGEEPKVTVYFSHSEPLIQTYTALDIFHDKIPLTYSNYKDQVDRQFRISVIDSFATNLAGILYRCQEGDKYRVQFLRNERPLNFEGCVDGVCPWSAVQKRFTGTANSCSLDVCKGDETESAESSSTSVFKINFLTMIFCFVLLKCTANNC